MTPSGSRKKTLVDIECKLCKVSEKAVAVSDGTLEDHQVAHGEIIKRERWFWLPKSQIEVDPEDYEVGDMVVVTMPEWLAQVKELI